MLIQSEVSKICKEKNTKQLSSWKRRKKQKVGGGGAKLH